MKLYDMPRLGSKQYRDEVMKEWGDLSHRKNDSNDPLHPDDFFNALEELRLDVYEAFVEFFDPERWIIESHGSNEVFVRICRFGMTFLPDGALKQYCHELWSTLFILDPANTNITHAGTETNSNVTRPSLKLVCHYSGFVMYELALRESTGSDVETLRWS